MLVVAILAVTAELSAETGASRSTIGLLRIAMSLMTKQRK